MASLVEPAPGHVFLGRDAAGAAHFAARLQHGVNAGDMVTGELLARVELGGDTCLPFMWVREGVSNGGVTATDGEMSAAGISAVEVGQQLAPHDRSNRLIGAMLTGTRVPTSDLQHLQPGS